MGRRSPAFANVGRMNGNSLNERLADRSETVALSFHRMLGHVTARKRPPLLRMTPYNNCVSHALRSSTSADDCADCVRHTELRPFISLQARPHLREPERTLAIVDSRIQGSMTRASVLKVAGLAYQCISLQGEDRPSMSTVVLRLHDANSS